MPRPTEPTLGMLLDEAARALSDARIETPRREARLIMAHITGCALDRQLVEADRPVAEAAAFRAAVARRAAHEPLAYITGRRGFWDLDFAVGPAVLVPRPETECLIEEALARLPDRQTPLRILDLGVGSGCILLTLLHLYPKATGIGIDRSPAALGTAAANARATGYADRLLLLCGNWAGAVVGPFDLVVSNPPYVTLAEHAALEPEVRLFEPKAALTAGADGLDAYRAIAPDLLRLLAPQGMALLEIGRGQELAVEAILDAAGMWPAGQRRDLAGTVRCLVALRRPARADA